MASITLYFVSGNEVISRVIRAAEMGFAYSHVGARGVDGTLISAHMTGGVAARAPDSEDPWTVWADVSIPCTNAQAVSFWAFLESQIGKPYDMGAIWDMAGSVLEAKQSRSGPVDAWFCSELQLAALQFARFFPWLPAPLRTVTPQDLFYMVAGLPGATMTPRAVGAA